MLKLIRGMKWKLEKGGNEYVKGCLSLKMGWKSSNINNEK